MGFLIKMNFYLYIGAAVYIFYSGFEIKRISNYEESS